MSSSDHTRDLTCTPAAANAAFTIWRESDTGEMRHCEFVCCARVWGREKERPQSPRDSVSHKLHHTAALLGLAWVRPLLSSSNMPATCSHTHTHTHTRACTHIHMCTLSPYTHIHTRSCIHKPAHMACKEFIWCFLVIATKTPNLDMSRSFPRTPEWRANFKQPPPLTLQTSVLFSPPAPSSSSSFFHPLISEEKKGSLLYTSQFCRRLFA